jgi:hypothetical protein
VTADAPPALLIAPQPGQDKLVNPQRNTGGLASALRALHRPVTETYFDHVGHATLVATLAAPLRRLAPTLDAVSAFIEANSGSGRVDAVSSAVFSDTALPASMALPPRAPGAATPEPELHAYDKTPAP